MSDLTKLDPSLLPLLEQKLAVELDRRQEKKRQRRLINFVRYFWDVLEPVQPFVEGWCLEALCLHLEAVTAGRIPRLLANVPPGFMKSLLVNVFWPAWEWGPMDLGHMRYVTFSYAAHLTERDNAKFRDLIKSKKYRDMWGDRVQLVEDGKVKVSNTKTGWKFASSVGGVGTGERGDRIICDDLHNIKESESEVIRSETVRWTREAMSNRLNNMDTGVIVAIMQRSHEADASNTLVELDYEHLMVPMEFDGSRRCETSIGWSDPRTKDGELAWPERFPRRVNDQIKKTIGPYAYSGQYQQTPEVRGGAIIKREWWQEYITDDGKIPACQYVVASLDPAYSAKQSSDPSGFTIWGVWYDEKGHSRIICLNAWRERLDLHGPHQDRLPGETEVQFIKRTQKTWGLVEKVAHSCKRFRVHKLLVESKASGLSVAQEIRRLHSGQGWTVQLVDPKGLDKVTRCHAVVPMFADGQIFLPAYSDGSYREWGQQLVDEFASFPKGATDDLVDSATQALTHIRELGLAVRRDERAMIERELGRHKSGKPNPLYPGTVG